MKKIYFISFLLFIVFNIFPIPSPNLDGKYNTFTGMIWCNNKIACYHEIGHKLDHENKWISRSYEFSLAVRAYLILEMQEQHPSQLVYEIMRVPGLFEWNGYFSNPQAEVYATIFEFSNGNIEKMPERFREFYDWERAEELIEKYVR